MTAVPGHHTLLWMPSLDTITAALGSIAPLGLAADWDAVGLLVGSRRADGIERVMTCLTLSPAVAREAAMGRADLVVTHHPLPFRPVARITHESFAGEVLLELLSAGIAVYSPHTAWDSACGGINDQLAEMASLQGIRPIEPHREMPLAGVGRMGRAGDGVTVGSLAVRMAGRLGAIGAHVTGDPSAPAGLVGIVCGSGGDLLPSLKAAGCTTMLTGEVRLHTAEEARASGIAVIAVGHHASEHFAMESLARRLSDAVAGLHAWASRAETDPLVWMPAHSTQGGA